LIASLARCLVVSKQGCTLCISLGTWGGFAPASGCGHSNYHGGDKESSHDGERKDPLEGDDLAEELGNTNGSRQDAEIEAHGVVLVVNDEEHAVSQDRPDENIAENAGNEAFGVVHHDRTIPVDSDKCPSEGS